MAGVGPQGNENRRKGGNRRAKETKAGEKGGRGSEHLIVAVKPGNWADRDPAERRGCLSAVPEAGNRAGTSRLESLCMQLLRIAWSECEPADRRAGCLNWARPDLWEPRGATPGATRLRASSVVENLNSRLRTYFFLRRHLGADYLDLLRFYLNHRRFPRSEHPERVGRSPAELLSGETQPSWLEQLGHRHFRRSA